MTATEMLNRELGDLVVTLEEARRSRIALLKRRALMLIGISLLIGSVQLFKGHGLTAGALSLLISVIVWIFFASRQGNDFSAHFKTTAMPRIVKCLGEDLSYYPWNCMDQEDFERCGLFISPDRYTGSDYACGYIGRTAVSFSLVHAEEEYEVTDTETDSDGHTTTTTRTEYRTIFSGLLFSADCNKDFHGVTFVCAGKSSFLGRRRSDFVSLESPDFNRRFSVFSSDQVEARYLLTPSLMERILELRSRCSQVETSFVSGRVFVAIPMSFGSFTPSIWRRIKDISDIAGYYNTLRFITGIVDDLNLNTRIWSKQ